MKNIKFFIIAVVAVVMTSCYTTRTYTGNFIEQTDHGDTNVMPYSKAKQWYVIGSLVPLGMKHAPTPSTGNCEVVTKTKFVDALLGECTLGLFAVRTIEVNAVASDGLTPLVKQKVKKEKYTIDNGLQYEIEVGTVGGSLGISYKFAKRFSIGAAYWYGMQFTGKRESMSVTRENDYYDWYEKGQDATTTSTESMAKLDKCVVKKFYFNAQIRPWDKAFSPILGGNLGWQTIATDEFYEPIYGNKQTQLYVTPYGGISYRLGKNCYLSLRVGYNMVLGKVKPKEGDKIETSGIIQGLVEKQQWSNYMGKMVTVTERENVGNYKEIAKYPKVGVSTPYAALNFTHTLPIGAGLHEKAIEKTRSVIDKVKKK